MGLFNNDYDAGFLNVPGFGQSATNPLAPVFYESLGIVKDLSVYQSVYATKDINAGVSFNVGDSSLSTSGFQAAVPATFLKNVDLQKDLKVANLTTTKRLIVNGREYKPTSVKANNGTFVVLAAA